MNSNILFYLIVTICVLTTIHCQTSVDDDVNEIVTIITTPKPITTVHLLSKYYDTNSSASIHHTLAPLQQDHHQAYSINGSNGTSSIGKDILPQEETSNNMCLTCTTGNYTVLIVISFLVLLVVVIAIVFVVALVILKRYSRKANITDGDNIDSHVTKDTDSTDQKKPETAVGSSVEAPSAVDSQDKQIVSTVNETTTTTTVSTSAVQSAPTEVPSVNDNDNKIAAPTSSSETDQLLTTSQQEQEQQPISSSSPQEEQTNDENKKEE